MEIRRYRESDDIDDVSRVYAQSWKTAYRGIVPQDFLDALADNRWSPILMNETSNLLIAAEGGDIVGAATYCPARDRAFAGWGEIISLYLVPQYWRRGIGTRLLREAMKALHDLGYQKLYLWVLEENRVARTFYEKNGFRLNGDRVSAEVGGKPLSEVRYIHTAEKPACR